RKTRRHLRSAPTPFSVSSGADLKGTATIRGHDDQKDGRRGPENRNGQPQTIFLRRCLFLPDGPRGPADGAGKAFVVARSQAAPLSLESTVNIGGPFARHEIE